MALTMYKSTSILIVADYPMGTDLDNYLKDLGFRWVITVNSKMCLID